jgi:hypothetical protein
MKLNLPILLFLILQLTSLQFYAEKGNRPSWKSLKYFAPEGTQEENIKCFTFDPAISAWKQPPFIYNQNVATRPVKSKVIVLVYNPVLKSKGNVSLIDFIKANNPRAFSDTLADVIRRASHGYINYEIVDYIEVNGFSEKVDGFIYTEDSFLVARQKRDYRHPDRSDYRKIFEHNKLIDRCKKENISEIWLWGAGGMGWDELAMYIPNRYARFAPTLNPWFYRPYEIPEEIGHTLWVMGFNYEVGIDNMIHAYNHRIESMLALVFGHGNWDSKLVGKDPFNTFTMLNLDYPDRPSQVGNVHVPPNGKFGYDYKATGEVLSYADAWRTHFPDMKKVKPRKFDGSEFGNIQRGYQEWWMFHVPSIPGYTQWGYNNWWVYIANTDENLPVMTSEDYQVEEFKPAGF